jgi:subtilase family serine protease
MRVTLACAAPGTPRTWLSGLRGRCCRALCLVAVVGLTWVRPVAAAEPPPWDERSLAPLHGSLRPEAVAAHDVGRVDDSLRLEHMQLIMRRPAEREQALETLIEEQHSPASPRFHHWLTPQQLGAQFGALSADTAAVTQWLTSRGFKVNHVYANGMVIDFSGYAGQVRRAFHTEIHNLMVGGQRHIANMREPQMPSALAAKVVGVVSMHDFRPHALSRPRSQHWVGAQFTIEPQGSSIEAVVPADLATIYNLNPLFSAGITGRGQTIVVIEDSDIYSARDFSQFRSTFGLSDFDSGGLSQVHPAAAGPPGSCVDPGVVPGVDGEAILDAEWAGAAAPGAAIVVASCADTRTTFGGLIALENLLNGSTPPPPIMSISYGECEALNGAAANAAYLAAYQQAAAEGVSVFVSAGDSGAAGCDPGAARAAHGVGVNAFASTPYNVAVGGTDFGDTFARANSSYWSPSNGKGFGSALSYIPEIPWNESCASELLTVFEGFQTAYGSAGFCNSKVGRQDFVETVAGGGGPSACSAGAPQSPGVIGGSCQGTPKPSWQAGVTGNPADGVRDLPDVSLFAGSGVWGHYYVYCYSDRAGGGTPCTGEPSRWSAAGGTSFGAPILAGIQALVNERTGQRWGNPAPIYYSLAQAQFTGTGGPSCDSASGREVGGACVFYDTTRGDIDVSCTGRDSCFQPSGSNGVLSTSQIAFQPAYASGVGWDFSTGLGSVNAYNLVMDWPPVGPVAAGGERAGTSGE